MQVVLYSQEHCGMCKAVHMQLDKLNVEYEDIILKENNIEECKAKGVTTTPTLFINGEKFYGSSIPAGIAKIRTSLGR